ncbi:12947_t:CDS:2, partial [Racocetra persica]
MIKTANGTPNHAQVCCEATQEWNKIKTKGAEKIDSIIKTYLSTPFNLYDIQTIKPNHFIPEETKERLSELKQMYNITTDPQFRYDIYTKIEVLQKQEVIKYDRPGRPSLLFKYPHLHDNIHESVEFENYGVYMAQTTLNNYLLPCQSNFIATKVHHHPAWVSVAGVSRTETYEHPD